MDAQELFDQLSAPFAPEQIEWRVGSTNKDKTKGMALAYIDARTVMDRLDTVCGAVGWQCSYTPGVNGSIICNIGIKFEDPRLVSANEWVWKADGAGATDFEGEKGALSDAFKRAAVRWGVGRYLYEIPAPWVVIEAYGKSYKIADAEKKRLDELYEKEAQKVGWGSPTDVATYRFLLKVVQETVTQPSDVEEFRKKNESVFPLLRVAQRRHLNEQLDRIGGATREAAE
jgi:hypothetical protein